MVGKLTAEVFIYQVYMIKNIVRTGIYAQSSLVRYQTCKGGSSMKVFKRLTSAFLLILLILQTMLTPAYADWAASGGGHGNSGVMGSGGGG